MNKKELASKIIFILGVNSMAAISGNIYAFAVSLTASGVILLKKDKTPHNQLKYEIKSSLKHFDNGKLVNYSNEDAEQYAKKLENMALQHYNKAYKESTIQRED